MITINLITENLADNVNIAIQRYMNHVSIVTIPRLITRKSNFSFSEVTHEKKFKIFSGIKTLRRFLRIYSVPIRTIKESSDLFVHFLLQD